MAAARPHRDRRVSSRCGEDLPRHHRPLPSGDARRRHRDAVPSDGRGLGSVFERMIETVDIPALQAAGYLVPVQTYAPSRPDLHGIHVRQGDYVTSELEACGQHAAARRRHRRALDLRLARGRPTAVFCASVKHSIHIRDRFREAGIMAEHLDGETPNEERDAILAKLASGEIEVLTNCAVLTEGWDCPPV